MIKRTAFPKRAVITAGMPYGSKDLHFGHIGGVFVHADVFSRFLRDRLGDENVIFISGTDCYGSPIVVKHKELSVDGAFSGSLTDFVEYNHQRQADTLENYHIGLSYFGASALGRCGAIHSDYSSIFFKQLYDANALIKMETKQFFDEVQGVFLNGRQVVGECPIDGCKSEMAYADECALGHQYFPEELLHPISTLSGEKPCLKKVTNWYFDLEKYSKFLAELIDYKDEYEHLRKATAAACREFLKDPIIYTKIEQTAQAKDTLAGIECSFQTDAGMA
jgi:methionyl-tRNA synthetase